MAESSPRERKLRARAKHDAQVRKTVVQSLMSHPDGRRYVWLELEKTSVFAQTFREGPGAALNMSFLEGKRAIGLALITEVTRWCPKEYWQMTVENSTVDLVEEEDDGGDSDSPSE